MSITKTKPVPKLTPEELQRFLKRVPKGLPKDVCWPWQGGRIHGETYGRFYVQGKTHTAHRVALSIKLGSRLKGVLALHTCDNPPCVNEAHLFKGTPLDNKADQMRKGRWKGGRTSESLRGTGNPRAKLTEEQVRAIRQRRAKGAILKDISKEFNMSIAMVAKIANRDHWKHII